MAKGAFWDYINKRSKTRTVIIKILLTILIIVTSISWFFTAMANYETWKSLLFLILGPVVVIVYRWIKREGYFAGNYQKKSNISYTRSNLILLTLFALSLLALPLEPVYEIARLDISGGNSMAHKIFINKNKEYEICGIIFEEERHLDFDEYWEVCGRWYEGHNISKGQFSQFPFAEGLNKKSLVIADARPLRHGFMIGDVITFTDYLTDRGDVFIFHRIVGISEIDGRNVFETKGDANNSSDDRFLEERIVGKAVFIIHLY